MLQTFIDDLKAWTADPYKEDGNVVQWFLFIGLLTCGTILWSRILRRIMD